MSPSPLSPSRLWLVINPKEPTLRGLMRIPPILGGYVVRVLSGGVFGLGV